MALTKIVQRLPHAWVFPELAVAEIDLDGKQFISKKIPKKTIVQYSSISINAVSRGTVKVHYPVSENVHFLQEEQHLIEKVAQELAIIIERAETRQREEAFEKKLQHNDRLAILGEITAGIAHELNTPLANILGFSQFIRNNTHEQQTRMDSEKIIQSALFAREVVKKLMLFSCDMPGEVREVDVNETVVNALKLLKPTIHDAKLQLEIEQDPHGPVARIDQVQITQLIFNLVINAIHASSEGSTIKIKISGTDSHFTLQVSDSGYGIPDDVKEKMFEPFFTTKQPGEGSGLGLSVVHGIVKSHKGNLIVQSEVGKGTTFTIEIPLAGK